MLDQQLEHIEKNPGADISRGVHTASDIKDGMPLLIKHHLTACFIVE